MDIDRANLWQKLPSTLKAISEAQFIPVNLEMSGILLGKAGPRTSPSLQQIYGDAKVAAETFTIMQFGLTLDLSEEMGPHSSLIVLSADASRSRQRQLLPSRTVASVLLTFSTRGFRTYPQLKLHRRT